MPGIEEPIIEQPNHVIPDRPSTETFSDLLRDFAGSAVVVETAEAPRFHVTWTPNERDKLVTFFVRAADRISDIRKEVDESDRVIAVVVSPDQ